MEETFAGVYVALRPYEHCVSRTILRTSGLIHREDPRWQISLFKGVILKKESSFFVDTVTQFRSESQSSKANRRLNFSSEPQRAALSGLKEVSESGSRVSPNRFVVCVALYLS